MNPYHNHTDSELLTLLNGGDRLAFAAIYERHASTLYRYARKNISTREDCEEIVQEIFIDIWARHKTLEVETLQFYLLRMVRYKVANYFRHHAVRKKYAEHFKLFEAVYENSNESDRDPSFIQEQLDKCISRLPAHWQTALRLRLNEDLSNADIAIRMNVPKRTIEGYMFAAYTRIRALYKP